MTVFTQSDIDFTQFVASRNRYRKRRQLFIPPAELRRRAYDDETEQLRRFIHGQHTTEKRTA